MPEPRNEDFDKLLELAKENREHVGKLTEAVHKAETERGSFSKEVRAEIEKQTKNLEEIAKRAKDLEDAVSALQTKLNRAGSLPGGTSEFKLPKSVADLYLESEEYKAISKRGGKVASSDWLDIGSFTPHLNTLATYHIRQARDFQRRAGNILATTQNVDTLWTLFSTMQMTDVMRIPTEQARLTDFMTVIPMSDSRLEYPKTSEFNVLYTELAGAEAIGQTVLSVDNAVGFREGATIVIDPGEASEETRVIAAAGVDMDANTLTVTVALAANHSIDAAVISTSYDYTPETRLKPQAQYKTEVKTVTAKTLATWIPITNQMIADVPMLRPLIEDELMDSLRAQRERNILYGDGSDTQLNGLFAEAGIQTYSWSAGAVGDTQMDAVRRAMTPVRLAHYDVDLAVINPQDWEDFELIKGADGHYLLSTGVVGAQRRLWATPVLITTSIEPGTVALGAFRRAWYLDREQGRISIGQPNDYFLRNMQAILAEERAAAAWPRPESFAKVTLDSAPV